MTVTAPKCPDTLKHVLHTKQKWHCWTAGAHPQVFLSVGHQSTRSVLTGSTLLAFSSDQNITASAATFLTLGANCQHSQKTPRCVVSGSSKSSLWRILTVNSVVQDMTYIRSFESVNPLALNTISPKVLLLAPPFVFPSSHSHGTVRQKYVSLCCVRSADGGGHDSWGHAVKSWCEGLKMIGLSWLCVIFTSWLMSNWAVIFFTVKVIRSFFFYWTVLNFCPTSQFKVKSCRCLHSSTLASMQLIHTLILLLAK